MTVTSHIYAQIEGAKQIYHIGDITYSGKEFAGMTINEGIQAIAESILDVFKAVEEEARVQAASDSSPHGQQPQADTSPGDVDQQL